MFLGFDSPPFSQEKVVMFVECTKNNYQKLVREGKELKVYIYIHELLIYNYFAVSYWILNTSLK